MKYKIDDEEHAEGGKTIEADTVEDALRQYIEQECEDADDGDEINVDITDESGNEYEGTAEVSIVQHVEVFCEKLRKTKPKANVRDRT